jgi:hypothetical protein
MGHLSLQEHTLTHHTRKHLALVFSLSSHRYSYISLLFRDAQRTSWRIAVNKGIQQQMVSIHGRLDLYLLSDLSIGSEGLVILSR